MISKKIKDITKMKLAAGRLLLKPVLKKSIIQIAQTIDTKPAANDVMENPTVQYATVVNSNGSKLYDAGDIIVIANYSTYDTFALEDSKGEAYIVIPEFNISAAVTPDNFEK